MPDDATPPPASDPAAVTPALQGEPESQSTTETVTEVTKRPAEPTDDLVTSEHSFFVATGISDGDLLHGVRYRGGRATTNSICSPATTSATAAPATIWWPATAARTCFWAASARTN